MLALVGLAAVVLTSNPQPSPSFPKAFFAKSVYVSTDGGVEDPGQALYVEGSKVRIDVKRIGQTFSVLIDLKDGDVWEVDHGDKSARHLTKAEADTYLGRQRALATNARPCADNDPKQSCSLAGVETVNGHKLNRWERKVENPQGTFVYSVWVDPALSYTVRSVDEKGYVSELREIKEGNLPPDTFRIPAGFTKK